MKKLLILLFATTLIFSCENEPIDGDLSGNNNNGGTTGGSESDDLSLLLYELDTQINFDFFGVPIESVTNSDINILNDRIVSGVNAFSVSGSPFETENQIITRNSTGQIISDISVNSGGITTNETQVFYTNGMITQITYDYYEDDIDDYTYNFTYDGNTITRTEVGSSISTIFTIDGFDRVIRKESFDGATSIQNESVVYSGVGNINSSVTTGEAQSNTSYQFDDNENPLKAVYEDNYLLRFLTDDYSDEIGPQIAQFLSSNNWSSATFNDEAFSFDLQYNTAGRIISRDIAYDFGAELAFEFNERFTYVN
ncbi:hypothetical protein [Winogradskyella vincentii]|uniref:YD repeat-containing protein n=1 Tax=Winogradskyella vincentii TaxID=2877122 RepID=A0ABS7XVS2_9FLAO|nr:hypothetical protein [Winogradskyella vincentii]MCA0151748.1 hypothetical protein [Winogradskyella vincentii]